MGAGSERVVKRTSEKRKALNVSRALLMEQKFGPRGEWTCWFADFSKNVDFTLAAMMTHAGPVNGHEVLKRSRGGSITDMENVVLLCDWHNGWVEDNPREAHAMGLALHSWEA